MAMGQWVLLALLWAAAVAPVSQAEANFQIDMIPSSQSVAVDSQVLVTAQLQVPPPSAAAKPPAHRVSLEGVNITFYRDDQFFISSRKAQQTPDPGQRNGLGEEIGTAATNVNGTATLLVNGFTTLGNSVEYVRTEVSATYPEGNNTVQSSGSSSIYFYPRSGDPPSLTPSSTSAGPGQPITVVITARDRNGDVVSNAPVTFNVDSSASLQVTVPPPPTPPQTRSPASKSAPQRGITQYTTTTDDNGQATITISSNEAATVTVSASYLVENFEQVSLPDINLTFQGPPPAGVTAIALTPETRTVRVGRYAQLSAALTPALAGVKVDFTATAANAMEAELEGLTEEDTPLSSESDDAAELANYRRSGYGKLPTQRSSAFSNAQGVATASLWSRRPGRYYVRATVVNNDSSIITSNRVTVIWSDDDDSSGPDSGDSDGRDYYGRPDESYHGHRHSGEQYRGEGRYEGRGDSHHSPRRHAGNYEKYSHEHKEYRHPRPHSEEYYKDGSRSNGYKHHEGTYKEGSHPKETYRRTRYMEADDY